MYISRMNGILIKELKTAVELRQMEHAELLEYAQTMRLEIRGLRGQLQMSNGFLEMACRPKDDPQH